MLDYKLIGAKIRELRKKKGLSQEQLAERIWISTTHMSHIETGTTKLSLPVLVDLAIALDVGADDILMTQPNLRKKTAVEDINKLLNSCTQQQAKVLEQIIKSAKAAMDQHL